MNKSIQYKAVRILQECDDKLWELQCECDEDDLLFLCEKSSRIKDIIYGILLSQHTFNIRTDIDTYKGEMMYQQFLKAKYKAEKETENE